MPIIRRGDNYGARGRHDFGGRFDRLSARFGQHRTPGRIEIKANNLLSKREQIRRVPHSNRAKSQYSNCF